MQNTKKGDKLASRLHRVDIILGSVFTFTLVGFFLFFYRQSTYVTIKVKVTDQDVLYANSHPYNWYADRFEVGDSELDTLGRKISELLAVETFNMRSNNKAVYLTMKVRGLYDKRTKLYSSKGKQLMFGMPMRFNMSKVTFDGIVVDFPGSETHTSNIKVEQQTVTAIVRGFEDNIEPSSLMQIHIGDKIYDSNGTILAEVKHIEIFPSERSVPDMFGKLHLRHDPIYKDAIITTQLRTITYKNEDYVFDYIPVKIGEVLPLNFQTVSIFPVIIRLH